MKWDERVLWEHLPTDIRTTVEASMSSMKGKVGNLILAERKRCSALAQIEAEKHRAEWEATVLGPNEHGAIVLGAWMAAAKEIAKAIEEGRQP